MKKEQDKSNNRNHRRSASWRNILHAVVALCLLAYLVVALSLAANVRNDRICDGIRISVRDTTSLKFVKPSEIARELGHFTDSVKGMKMIDIDTDSIERALNAIDKIERASVVRLSDGFILVTVDPMHPVLRVFDNSSSYYINRDGKRISADARYHVDVPVIQGHFPDSGKLQPDDLLPLLDYIAADSLWNSLVSMVKVDSPSDIIIVPIIRGHVVNLGTLTDFPGKFSRLKRMYTDVLPVKGWDHYDTISVKWGGQVVATRRNKRMPRAISLVEEEDETFDEGTMLIE